MSEGTLFKRFATKDGLFLAAMGLHEIPAWANKPVAGVGQGDARENLIGMVLGAIGFFRDHMPCALMVWSSGIGSPFESIPDVSQSPPRRLAAEEIRDGLRSFAASAFFT